MADLTILVYFGKSERHGAGLQAQVPLFSIERLWKGVDCSDQCAPWFLPLPWKKSPLHCRLHTSFLRQSLILQVWRTRMLAIDLIAFIIAVSTGLPRDRPGERWIISWQTPWSFLAWSFAHMQLSFQLYSIARIITETFQYVCTCSGMRKSFPEDCYKDRELAGSFLRLQCINLRCKNLFWSFTVQCVLIMY